MRLRNQGVSDDFGPYPTYYFNPATDEFREFQPEDVRELRNGSVPQWHPRKVSKAVSELQDNDKVTFYVTVRYKYEKTGADVQKYYDTRDLREAAEIDRKNLEDYPEFISEDLLQNERPFEVTINTARTSGADV